jgi:thiol-disulfide isomerase/thioredoxin
MKSAVAFILICSLIAGCKVKPMYNQTKFDEKSNSNILYGYTNLQGLKTEPYSYWFDTEFEAYQPDIQILEQVNIEKLDDFDITIVMGTWCSDSQREVPRFYKMLESIGYETNKIILINVDRTKLAEGTPTAKLDIKRIPTFIFAKKGVEAGRIVETPQESLEKDMAKIIEK